VDKYFIFFQTNDDVIYENSARSI